MKNAGWWSGVLFLGMALPAWAQQEYIYVTGNADSSVTVMKQAVPPTSAPIVQKTIFDPRVSGPFDILYDSGRRRLYISNNTAKPGTIAVIDATTTAVIGTFSVLASQNLLGMALSDDGNFLYVAGQLVTPPLPTITPAVFEINLTAANPQGTLLDSNGAAGDAATSVVVIPARLAGGSGNGPGRIYYTVPQIPNGPGYIAVAYKIGAGPTSFTVGPATGNPDVTLPTRMARSPDGTIAFATCTNNVNLFMRLLRIDAVANTCAEATIGTALATGQATKDVSFRPETVVQTAYVWGSNATAGDVVWQVDSTGASLTSISPAQAFALGSIRHHLDPSGNDFIYLGDGGGGAAFGRINAAGGALVTMNPGGAGKGATYFAFAPMPAAPLLFDCAPKGQVNSPNVPIILKGQNFLPGAQVSIGGTIPTTTTFVSPSELDLVFTGVTAGADTVQVMNPDAQMTSLQNYYELCGAAVTNSPLALPSLDQGYALFSVPQYSSLAQVQQAFETALGPYNPMNYRVFFWNADHYDELNQIGSDPQDMSGRAFWVITRSGGAVSVPGLDCFANSAGAPRVIPLTPGWNLVSNPLFDTTLGHPHMNWNTVQVTTDGSNLASAVATNSPSAASIIDPNLWQFAGGMYQTTGVLVAGSGYWVNNISGGYAYLVFNPGNLFKLVGPPPAGGGGGSPPPGPPGAALGDSTGGTSCALLGPELLLLALAFHRRRWRRRLGA
jgi:hypothetical protein